MSAFWRHHCCEIEPIFSLFLSVVLSLMIYDHLFLISFRRWVSGQHLVDTTPPIVTVSCPNVTHPFHHTLVCLLRYINAELSPSLQFFMTPDVKMFSAWKIQPITCSTAYHKEQCRSTKYVIARWCWNLAILASSPIHRPYSPSFSFCGISSPWSSSFLSFSVVP